MPASAPPANTGPVAGVSFSGKVMGNGLPVAGASVQLYEAGTTGNGSAATALLQTSLATDNTGSFTVPSTFICPTANTVLYLMAKGGHAGASNDNSALWLLAPLGPC